MAERLTPREIECVRLAGERLTDDEIAQRLGLSRKTVANHLQHAYAKLGVRDRRRAAERLGIHYPGAEIPISEVGGLRPDAQAEAGRATFATAAHTDEKAWWRLPPPPKDPWVRLALILMFALLGLVTAVGGAAILSVGLDLTQSTAPAAAR